MHQERDNLAQAVTQNKAVEDMKNNDCLGRTDQQITCGCHTVAVADGRCFSGCSAPKALLQTGPDLLAFCCVHHSTFLLQLQFLYAKGTANRLCLIFMNLVVCPGGRVTPSAF